MRNRRALVKEPALGEVPELTTAPAHAPVPAAAAPKKYTLYMFLYDVFVNFTFLMKS